MALRISTHSSETRKKQSLLRRMSIVHGVLVVALLIIIARLIDLQIIHGSEYRSLAQAQHYGGVVLPAKRGEILALDSRTGETNILATNTTLDEVYVDPLITTNPTAVAESLADILLTDDFHKACTAGDQMVCPRELQFIYATAFDPLAQYKLLHTGALLEPLPATGIPPTQLLRLPDIVEARRLFARDIEQRISEKRVTFAPIKYGATKVEMATVIQMQIPGVEVSIDQKLISANPELVPQSSLSAVAHGLAMALDMDASKIEDLLRSRPLRYISVMRHLPPELSLKIKEAQLDSYKQAVAMMQGQGKKEGVQQVDYPLRSVALLPEHWRYYPDGTLGAQVVGFLNTNSEPQYGIERTFDVQLRGQQGLINTVSDPHGGQILTGEQTVIQPKDGDTVVLTIDRNIQKQLETILENYVNHYRADSGQAIVMDPYTGRILAMANAPLFDSNDYAVVFEKVPIPIDPVTRQKVVVEVYDPASNTRIVKAYIDQVFTASGRTLLPDKVQAELSGLEKLYDLKDLTHYYLFIGPYLSIEVFPTDDPGIWLKYKNTVGVGSYLNRAVQEIYEPGSVMKPIIMSSAIDQGEVVPEDTYDDNGPVTVDQYKIDNNDFKHYGHVTMTNCLEFSINTCMTSIGFKLGAKLLYRMIENFGFGSITGIEIEDELPGEVRPWREWSRTLLATTSFGQGLSATPLQVITAWGALANGGQLMRPTIIDSVIHEDGTVDKTQPHIISQVITKQTSETITAMLAASATYGFAKSGKVAGYRSAGKTGTSQIAGPGGRYITGTGSTFATYAGYAPLNHPRFVVLVKLDHPQNSIHGAVAAAPVFHDIAQYLFKYYDIPPDEK